MLKRILFAVVPLVMVAGTVSADDNLLAKLANLNEDAVVEAADANDLEMGQADVDALLGDDEDASQEDAVAACFRRIGYGYGYRHYNYGHSYSHSYNYHYCAPVYHSYTYYRPVHCYRPVYTHCYTPVYTSYWGCL